MFSRICYYQVRITLNNLLQSTHKSALTICYNPGASENGSLRYVMFHLQVDLHLVRVET